MKRLAVIVAFCASTFGAVSAGGVQSRSKPLTIYVVDTEGGKAALYVSPSGQSLLLDAGNPGGRDTDRILDAAADAGLKQIDYLVLTHYHVDHVGGVQELAKRFPIAHYVDHGPTAETREQVPGFQQMYSALTAKPGHTVVAPGDRVPIGGLDWRIVSSAGNVIKTSISGKGTATPSCATFAPTLDAVGWRDPEDAQSIGSVITFGRFRAIDLGDLLWNEALGLACPNNLIGTTDVYFVTGHGAEVCNTPPLLDAIRPRVAIMQNGPRKGGAVASMQTLRTTSGVEDLWQLHWSYSAGLTQNSPGNVIANIEDPARVAEFLTTDRGATGRARTPTPAHSAAYWIKLTAWPDGSFVVTNSRNGFSKTYPPAAR